LDILKEVHDYIRSEFQVDRALTPDENLLGSGILDSMSLLKLVTFLEERFGFEVRENEIVPDNFGSLEQLRAYVARRTGA
jgi:acyl carrier protein